MASSTRLLGIDPGLKITGYGVMESAGGSLRLVEAGIIRGGDRGDIGLRLEKIYDGVVDILTTFQPHSLALEELYSHYERPRTAILMGHARGAICLAAAKQGVPVVSYAATQIKRILTGSGRASKAQVQRAIQMELNLNKTPEPPDVADALAIALCHHHLGGRPRELT